MLEQPNRFTSILLFSLAFGISIFHLFQGVMSIFVFKENEPLMSWICMLSGPMSTLPATITALLNRKIGGYWLISGGTISGISFIWRVGMIESWFFTLIVTVPMIFLGAAFLKVPRTKRAPNSSEWSAIPHNLEHE
jgi:hypothetical protein